MPVEGPRCQAHGTTNSPGGIPRLLVREKLDQHGRSSRISAKILAQRAIKRQFWAIVSTQGELFRARTHIMPGRAKNIAHEARQHGGFTPTHSPASKGDNGFRQPGHLAYRVRPQCPRALKLCTAPPFHTWTLQPARGTDDTRMGPTTRTLT